MLIFGDSGSGKTTLLGTAQDSELTSPVFLLDIEAGTSVLSDKPLVDVKQARTMAAVQEVADALHKYPKYYKTFELDGFTELREIDMQEVMQQQYNKKPETTDLYVPSPREWGKSGSRVKELLRYLKDLPCHVIVTALVSADTNERTGITSFHPMMPGQLKGQVPGFFDIVGFLRANTRGGDTVRTLQFAKTERVMAKDRTKCLPASMDEPTIPKIWNCIFSKETPATIERTIAPELLAQVAKDSATQPAKG